MDKDQEREYINAKMEMLSKEKQTTEVGKVFCDGEWEDVWEKVMQNLLISCVDTTILRLFLGGELAQQFKLKLLTSAAQTQQ